MGHLKYVNSVAGFKNIIDSRDKAWRDQWQDLYESYLSIWDSDLVYAFEVIGEKWKEDVFYAIRAVEVALWDYNFGESKTSSCDLESRLKVLDNLSQSIMLKNKPPSGFFGSDSEYKNENYALYLKGLLGQIYADLARAAYRFVRKSFVKGAYSVRKSWVGIKDAIEIIKHLRSCGHEIEPEIEGSINFGYGLFNFIISLIPPGYHFIVPLLGFEGDREVAIKELTKCKESGCTKIIEGTILLYLLARFFTNQEERADFVLDEILKDYSNSCMVCYICGFIYRFRGENDLAIRNFSSAESRCLNTQMKLVINYHLGTSYTLISDYQNSSKHHKIFFESTTGEQFVVWSRFQYGMCQWHLTKNAELVKAHFEFVARNGKDDNPLDHYALRKVKEWIKNGGKFSSHETLLLKICNLHEAKMWEQALLLLKELDFLVESARESDKEFLALYYYYTAGCKMGLRYFEESKSYYKKFFELERYVKRETYVVPYAWCELAEIEMIMTTDWKKIRGLLKKSKKYKNYDWSNLLNVRINAALQKVARKENEFKYFIAICPPAPGPNGELNYPDVDAIIEECRSFSVSKDDNSS